MIKLWRKACVITDVDDDEWLLRYITSRFIRGELVVEVIVILILIIFLFLFFSK